MSRVLISAEDRHKAHEMRLAGMPWQKIEIDLGINWESMRRSIREKSKAKEPKPGRKPYGRNLAAPWHELRFHVMRLGTRKKVAQLYGVGMSSMYKAIPVTDTDLYQRGQMVSIGGVLAKKCLKCGTARELEHFWSNPSEKSGCRETCYFCRVREAEQCIRH